MTRVGDRLRDEAGGAIGRLLKWVLLLALLASAGLWYFVASQSPLAIGRATVAGEGVGRDLSAVPLRADGHVVVAMFLRNTGRLPLTLEGPGALTGAETDPYVPVALRLGDGSTASLAASAPFTPLTLRAGESVGIAVVFGPNPHLRCARLPARVGADTERTPLERFAIRYSVYGIEQTQVLTADPPFAIAAPVARADCQAAVAAVSAVSSTGLTGGA